MDTLRLMGITPDGIVGHSVGELGCGYADGSLTAEETVLAAYWRGRCIRESNLPPGGMAAVGKWSTGNSKMFQLNPQEAYPPEFNMFISQEQALVV